MPYTIGEIAKVTNISQRSIYNYIQRHLVPPAIKNGKEFIYTDEHVEALRLIKVLLRLGLPLRQVEGFMAGRERGAIHQIVAPILLLTKLLEETESRIADLQRKIMEPNLEELDFKNLGLEDPVSLRHNLVEAELQRNRLQGEFESAGADLLRDLAGSPNTGITSDIALTNSNDELDKLRLQLESLDSKISRQLEDILMKIEQMQYANKKDAFMAGLMAAYEAGWRPNPIMQPSTKLQQEFSDVFSSFMDCLRNTNTD